MATLHARFCFSLATALGVLATINAAPTNQDAALKPYQQSVQQLQNLNAATPGAHKLAPLSRLGDVLSQYKAAHSNAGANIAALPSATPARPPFAAAATSNSAIVQNQPTPNSISQSAPLPNAPVPAQNTNQTPRVPSHAAQLVSKPSPDSLSNTLTNHFVLDTANLDIDADGCISGEAELDLFKYHVATALIGNPDALLRAHSIVHRTDINKDGRICWCDFISIYLHDKNTPDVSQHAAPFMVILGKDSGVFSHLDHDGDGKLQGLEKESLVHQFAQCIPAQEARLIVDAISGLLDEEPAVSQGEFARFLGAEHVPVKSVSDGSSKPISPTVVETNSEAQPTQPGTGQETPGSPANSKMTPINVVASTPPNQINENERLKTDSVNMVM